MRMPQRGEAWRFYKLLDYPSLFEIIGTGHHTETTEALVIYRQYGRPDAPILAKPLQLFLGKAEGEKLYFEFEREPGK